MPDFLPVRPRRMIVQLRRLASQICVSVTATVCASALFSYNPTIFRPSAEQDGTKVSQRLPDGAIPTTTLQIDPQQSALRASLASFTPAASMAAATDTKPTATLAGARLRLTSLDVLPPPRPTTFVAPQAAMTMPVPAPVAAAAPVAIAGGDHSWRVAGVSIPRVGLPSMSLPPVGIPSVSLPKVELARVVPGVDLIARGSASAWDVSAGAVRKVAEIGVGLGRMVHVPSF